MTNYQKLIDARTTTANEIRAVRNEHRALHREYRNKKKHREVTAADFERNMASARVAQGRIALIRREYRTEATKNR